MARRTLNRMELRAEAEAAEAMGIKDTDTASRSASRPEGGVREAAEAGPDGADAGRLGGLRRRRPDRRDVRLSPEGRRRGASSPR